MSAMCIRSPRVNTVPTESRETFILGRSSSASVISSGSSIGCRASSTTRAVINLVIEAMGAATSELREYRIEESLWSMMRTELDLSLGSGAGLAAALRAKAVNRVPASAAIGARGLKLNNGIRVGPGRWILLHVVEITICKPRLDVIQR